jgi:hypothetical protein
MEPAFLYGETALIRLITFVGPLYFVGSYSDPSAKNPESWLKKLYINPNEIK